MSNKYKRALVIGSSGGIGSALARDLPANEIIALSRSGGDIDVTQEDSIAHALADVPPPVDLIIVATGALEIAGRAPEKSLKALEPKAMMDQFALNAMGPALVIKHALPLLDRNRQSILACLSARVGSIGDNELGGWVSYRAAKAALNQIVRTASIELSRTHPHSICVALHPGTVTTPLTQKYLARHPSVSTQDAAANLIAVLASLSPEDTGKFFDWAGKEVPW